MKNIIGISWNIGCWKTTISEYLRDKVSLQVYENSDVLKKEAQIRGIEPCRENLIDIAKEWQDMHWEHIIAKKLLDSIEWGGIISGIRLLDQARYLMENSEFKLIYVESRDEIIFERILGRGKSWDPLTREELEKLLQIDWHTDFPKLKEYADIVIANNGTLNELHKILDAFTKDTY